MDPAHLGHTLVACRHVNWRGMDRVCGRQNMHPSTLQEATYKTTEVAWADVVVAHGESGVDRGLDMGVAAVGLAMAPVGAFGRMACESVGDR